MAQEQPKPVNTYYADFVAPWVNPFSLTLKFGKRELVETQQATPKESEEQVPGAFSRAFPDQGVRVGVPARVVLTHQMVMNPGLAKAMVMQLRKMMKAFEEDQGHIIQVPPKVMEEMSLVEEDW
jgi:hypothetical protein